MKILLHPWFVPMVMAAERPDPKEDIHRDEEYGRRDTRSEDTQLVPFRVGHHHARTYTTGKAGARFAMGCFEETAAMCPNQIAIDPTPCDASAKSQKRQPWLSAPHFESGLVPGSRESARPKRESTILTTQYIPPSQRTSAGVQTHASNSSQKEVLHPWFVPMVMAA